MHFGALGPPAQGPGPAVARLVLVLFRDFRMGNNFLHSRAARRWIGNDETNKMAVLVFFETAAITRTCRWPDSGALFDSAPTLIPHIVRHVLSMGDDASLWHIARCTCLLM